MSSSATADGPPRNLAVLHIAPGSYRPNDREHSTYAIWQALASGFRRYEVLARSAAQPAEWTDGRLGVHLIRSRMRRELEFLWKQFELVPLGRELAPDIIVCQSPALGGLAALRIARCTGAGLLMEIHQDTYVTPARPGSRNWILQKLSEPALAAATRVRVLSRTMAKQFLERYGDEFGDRLQVLPPRVDLSRFPPKTVYRQGERLRLVTVGTVDDRKGQLRLIDALQESDLPIDLHIVGEGPDLAACRERARTAPSSLRIECHGALDHDRLAAVLRDQDVFILYSRSEGTPRAIMEAMAAGLPVVTTGAGFCADIVLHQVEGIVLGPHPDNEIVGVLDSLFKHPEELRRMGLAARARAERDYDAAVLFDRYRSLIAEAARR